MISRCVQLVPWAALALAAAPWAAQLDLPRPSKPRPRDPAGVLQPPPPPKGDLAPRDGASPLDLPETPALPSASAEEAGGVPAEAARALFRDLVAMRDVRHAAPVLERLLVLGPAVVPVARAELEGNHGPVLLAAGRLLLLGGTSADRAAVAERLERPLPADVAAPLLAELVARDPTLAPPEYLAGLLDHPTAAMRTAAVAELEPRAERIPLATLAPLLTASRTASRSAALELVARSEDPLSWNLLASRLGDPSAQLARRAAELLAAIDGAEPLVLERAFPAELRPGPLAWDRARAYALLSVIQREEGTERLLLGEAHIEPLRAGISSSLPVVTGACAVGLARVGFRIGPSKAGPWLDRDVPHMLVRCGTGAEFHNDFSALERPALRALALLTGESFGADGDAWREWWLARADDFRARHAVIEVTGESARELLVWFRDASASEWSLLAPGRTPPAGAGAVLRLDLAAAERLCELFESRGVFGVERMPAGGREGAGIVLRVAVGAQEKAFARAAGEPAGWLEELLPELGRLVEENRWQLYFDPAKTSAGAWWLAEHERFAALAPVERSRALVPLVIEAAHRTRGAERDREVAELERLYRDAAVPAAADLAPLLALLASETAFEARAGRLLELARVAAATASGASPALDPRVDLVSVVLERFGTEADPALARLARDLDAQALGALASDPRPRARALAVHGLVRAGDAGAGEELVRALLSEPDLAVQRGVLAALEGCPEERVPGLRPLLLERARTAGAEQRCALLRVLAPWGGKDVHDLALEAVADSEPDVQLAGVTALAELADPRSASLLASLLARGPDSPLYPAARRGLVRMGTAGIDECLRLARSSGLRARREGALLLAEAGVPEAAGFLLALLEGTPSDERVAWELSVLAGQDFLGAQDPAGAARGWWELVVHDDPLAWLLAAAERAGVPAPPRTALEGGLSAEGARFLLALADLPAPELAERAMRALEHGLGVELARPGSNAERAGFRVELHEAVRARFGE